MGSWGKHRWCFEQADAIGSQPMDDHKTEQKKPQLPASFLGGKELREAPTISVRADWWRQSTQARPLLLTEVPAWSNMQTPMKKVKEIEESGKDVTNKGTR